ncbi:MAG: hypothetical protein AMJ54_00870 [Deltaproteobacteria bacterium SG8_13]|nr:MAG: hypothetical protein AMJ54_00870 [Deltaproteobacteria bacterium SG8_13]
MRYDEKPVHRKLIVPWYDNRLTCLIVILSMLVVFLFALAGISAAGESPIRHKVIWLPILLMGLSASVIISTAVRLFKRFKHRFPRDL